MKNPIYPLAEMIYKKRKATNKADSDTKVLRRLSVLNPLGDIEKLYDSYQIKKIAAVLLIFVMGIVSVICSYLCSQREGRLTDGAQLFRNEWGAGDYKVMLQAVTQEWSREIPFLVEERTFTENEKEQLLKRIYKDLPAVIKKENQDLDHVTGNLDLVSLVDGYPFRISWSCTDSGRIGQDGSVDRKGIRGEGMWEELTAKISGLGKEESFTYKVFLLPELSNEEEAFFEALKEELEAADSVGKSRKEITLPAGLDGRDIVWKEVKQNNTLFLLILTLTGCVFVGRGMENDLERDCKRRKEQLIMEYPGFVSKLRLYLSAGLNVKNAFIRMKTDYGSQNKGKSNYLWEELKSVCYQMENGVMEEQAYQEFGRRCEEMRYRRLSFLLSVHLKQGNNQLLTLLAGEADNAQEDRRKMAKKMGEEAGTRLLLPMMMMLVVVMFLILMPAYLDFGSI